MFLNMHIHRARQTLYNHTELQYAFKASLFNADIEYNGTVI